MILRAKVFAAAAASLVALAAAYTPAYRGPGAVIDAVKQLLAAQSAANAEDIARLIDTSGDHLYGVDLDADGKGKEITEDAPMAFFDVVADGKPMTANSAHAATKLMLACGAKRTLRTVRANCHSAECSMATFEFDSETGKGKEAKTVAMRGTALLRYDNKVPGFRVFHWHASPAR